MTAKCKVCGSQFAAKHPRATYCSDRCRKQNQRTQTPQLAAVSADPEPESALVGAVRRQLGDVGRLDTPDGLAALEVAKRASSPTETGAAVAALMRVFALTMDRALEGVAVAADPLDELRLRRDRLRSG